MDQKRVILIDDDPFVRRTVESLLGDLDGCEVRTLEGPARDELIAPADLLLVDVEMPEVYGDDVAQFLRHNYGVTAPIYLFSSVAEEELARRTKEAGADGYIYKGWGFERFVEIVRSLLWPDGEKRQ